jgi:hypothetical protein
MQLGAVDAGKPFALVQYGGIETAPMNDNVPAHDDTVRAVVPAAQADDLTQAMQLLGGKLIEADGSVVGRVAGQ